MTNVLLFSIVAVNGMAAAVLKSVKVIDPARFVLLIAVPNTIFSNGLSEILLKFPATADWLLIVTAVCLKEEGSAGASLPPFLQPRNRTSAMNMQNLDLIIIYLPCLSNMDSAETSVEVNALL